MRTGWDSSVPRLLSNKSISLQGEVSSGPLACTQYVHWHVRVLKHVRTSAPSLPSSPATLSLPVDIVRHLLMGRTACKPSASSLPGSPASASRPPTCQGIFSWAGQHAPPLLQTTCGPLRGFPPPCPGMSRRHCPGQVFSTKRLRPSKEAGLRTAVMLAGPHAQSST